ncbi:Amuc_1100 family pilus-like protein [Verrucomicrobiales bacterium BCK34]|nr:Amuc_1100 family pilus-like protein [Verrucomicrobiales bacterium BCK34]
MNSKVWLIVFGVFSAVLIGGSGFFAFSKYKEYSDADSSWNTKVGTIESLEARVPYPNEENEAAVKKQAVEYDAAVKGLFESLNTFQKPLRELENTAFQQLVKKRVEEFREFAQAGGMAVDTVEEFQLGFDRYSATLPPPELVSILDYELDAIDNLLRELVTAGVTSMGTFERDVIPGEVAGTEANEEGVVVHKYPVRLRFVAPHDSFQSFVNRIANDENYFYIVRVLKVKNQVTEGAPKLTSEDGSAFPVFEDQSTKQVAGYEMLLEWGYGTESEEAVQEKAKAAGFTPASKDARVIMGQEQLEVFMIVDIARFVNPDDVVAKEKVAEDDKKKTRKR